MKTSFYKSMFVQALIPVFWVLALYITMNTITTYYVVWIEQKNQRVFAVNFISVQAAENLRAVVWRLAALCPVEPQQLPAFREQWKTANPLITSEYRRLKESAHHEKKSAPLDGDEQIVIALESPLNDYQNAFEIFVNSEQQIRPIN